MQYWLNFVMWNFWAWKTFWTYLDLFDLDKKENYIISNVPYSIVDYYFSTSEQLINVFDILEQYMYNTNEDLENYFDMSTKQKNIILVVDEAQIYLGARESLTKASILNRLKLVLTQCRKRKIKVFFITQRLSQVDIYVRRLSDFVVEYNRKSFLWLITRVKKTTYENKWDVADIESDNITKISWDWEMNSYKEDAKLYSEFFSPLTTLLNWFVFFSSSYRRILKEEFVTYHIVWYINDNIQPLTLDNLIKWLYNTQDIVDNERNYNFLSFTDKLSGDCSLEQATISNTPPIQQNISFQWQQKENKAIYLL